MKKYMHLLKDSVKKNLLELRQHNAVRLYRYADALDAATVLLKNYVTYFTTEERESLTNNAAIWKLLQKTKPQQVRINQSCTLRLKRDKANLQNLPVTSGSDTTDFIFDTGANFSVTTKTYAQIFKMQVLPGTIKVNAITGIKVDAEIAVCPFFRIGEIVVSNAVFLVMADSALAFPQIGYQINGIIGFPVLEALNEMSITKDDLFIVNKRYSAGNELNFALDFLTPVIRINQQPYTFDTGADETILYANYFAANKQTITANNTETDFTFGGAGGYIKRKGFYTSFKTVLNNKIIQLDSVQVVKEPFNEKSKHYFGNIGQDLMGQFQSMTINFKSMFIRFD
jgi:hypothetical protein